MSAPHLRCLLGRAASLPSDLAAHEEAWQRVGVAAARQLAELTEEKVSLVGASLGATSAAALRTRRAGILCPLAGATGFVELSRPDATIIAEALLRAPSEGGDEPTRSTPVAEDADEAEPLRLLDTLLVRTAGATITEAAENGFGGAVGASLGEAEHAWPLQMEDGPWLRVAFSFALAERAFGMSLLLGGALDAFAAPVKTKVPNPALRRAALAAPARLDAEIDRWRVPAGRTRLRVGDVLPLPGASIEALALRVRTRTGQTLVAEGELGTARGARAVRVTRVGVPG